MKSSTKRLLSLVIVLAMALSMLPMISFAADAPTTLYVKPNANWLKDGARFAAYFFGNGDTWVDCSDADGDGIYEVAVPAGYTSIIFCRMNPKAAANNWTNKWNQTGDLKIPTDDKICYMVPENTWDKGVGQWVEYTPEGGAGETEPTTASPIKYSVAGEATLCGSAWTPEDINNMMLDEDNDGIYSITYDNVAAGTYQFKVTDGTWNNSWGKADSNDNYSLTLDADAKTVEIRFNTETKLVEVIVDGVVPEPPVTEPTEPSVTEPFVPGVREYCLVGFINGADYGCNDDHENVGEYIFVDGKLSTSFTADSYIFVKTTDNANWLLTEAYCSETTGTFVVGGSEKMFVPGNAELIFTLVENEDGSVTVSYEIGQTIPTESTEPVAAEYYVAGTVNGWNEKDEAYKMTGDNGVYTLTFAVTAGDHALKVTDGTWNNSWGGDGPDGNYVFTAKADGEVTVTFDGTTVTVTGDVIAEKEQEALVINSVHLVGATGLTGADWDVTGNVMTGADGVYTITLTGVKAGTYEFKFAANGSWDLNWASGDVMESEVEYVAYKNAMGNSKITVPVNDATVTLTLDLTEMDAYTGEGGKCSVVLPANPNPDPDPVAKEYALVGYINGADYGCNEDWENVGEYIFVDGKLTATFTADSYVFVKTTDNANWYLTEAYCTETTGTFVKNAGEKMFVPGNVELTFTLVENEDGTLTVSYTTAAPAGVTVSGAVTTGADGDATIELIADGNVVATATASGKTGNYALENVAAGTYTLKVSKLNHVTREYTVTVEGDLTQDVKIHMVGDVDGNGKINVGDVSKINSHIKSGSLTDEYMILCANVNGGKLNMGDVSTLYAHIKGTKKLY